MAIIIGTLVGLVFLILCVILGIHIVRTVRKHRVATDSSENSEVMSKYGTRASVHSRLWQDRGKWMEGPSDTPLQDARDRQQMNVISKAMNRVSNIVSICEAMSSQYLKGCFLSTIIVVASVIATAKS